MLIKLNHQNLEVYKGIRELTKEIYQISSKLPADERFNMIQQIKRAGLSIKLNLAEGSSRKSIVERKRFLEITRGSLIEVDAILETAVDLEYLTINDLSSIARLLNQCFAMLYNMIK